MTIDSDDLLSQAHHKICEKDVERSEITIFILQTNPEAYYRGNFSSVVNWNPILRP